MGMTVVKYQICGGKADLAQQAPNTFTALPGIDGEKKKGHLRFPCWSVCRSCTGTSLGSVHDLCQELSSLMLVLIQCRSRCAVLTHPSDAHQALSYAYISESILLISNDLNFQGLQFAPFSYSFINYKQ